MTAPVSRPNLPPARHTRGRDQALWYRPVKVRGYMTTRAMASTACRATCAATTRAESRPGARAGRGRSHGESGAVVRRGGTGAGRGRTGARLGSCRPGARGSDGARRGPKSTGALLGDQEVRLETRVYHPDVARGRPDRPRAKYRGSISLFFPRASFALPSPAATATRATRHHHVAARARDRRCMTARWIPARFPRDQTQIHATAIDQSRPPWMRAKTSDPLN